jgi:hypothetical protein
MHWGLIPNWAKDPTIGNRMINARADSLTEKPAFRQLVETRRCIVPAIVIVGLLLFLRDAGAFDAFVLTYQNDSVVTAGFVVWFLVRLTVGAVRVVKGNANETAAARSVDSLAAKS